MRIDAHQHFWTLARGDYRWLTAKLGPIHRDFTPGHLSPLLAKHGIEKTVLVQAADSLAETRFLLSIASQCPFVAGVVGWFDMEADDAGDVATDLARDAKLRGVRPMIQDIEDPDWMLRSSLVPAFDAIERLGLCFDALVLPRHLKNLHALLVRRPDLVAVVDHGAKPEIRNGAFEPWAGDIARVARDTSACCKLSGLVTEAAAGWTIDDLRRYVDHLLAEFGADRLLWGSDWPVLTLAGTYDRWIAATDSLLAGLDAKDRDAILGDNARRFYRLDAV